MVHLADGYLEPEVAAGAAVVAVVGIGMAARLVPRREVAEPLVGLVAAFVLVAQMVNFPVASVVSGHLLGGAVVAILLGIPRAVLVMTAVLILQALLLQDGGILALGANLLNVGILAPVVGGVVFAAMRRSLVGAFLAGWAAAVVPAGMAGVELGLSGVAPTVMAVGMLVGVHAVVGTAEGMVTLFLVRYLARRHALTGEIEVGGRVGWRGLAAVAVVTVSGVLLVPISSGRSDGLEASLVVFESGGGWLVWGGAGVAATSLAVALTVLGSRRVAGAGRDGLLVGGVMAVVVGMALLPWTLDWWWHVVPAVLGLVVFLGVRVSWGHLVPRLLIAAPALLGAVVFVPLLADGGWPRAGVTGVKVAGVMFWLTCLTWVVAPERLLMLVRGACFPGWLVDLLGSTYRGLGLLSREVKAMQLAYRSRSRGVGQMRRLGELLGVLFVRVRGRADRQATGLRSRDSVGDSGDGVSGIELREVSFRYPGATRAALTAVSLRLCEGKRVAVLGTNGAGKTTLLLHLNGLLRADVGKVRVGKRAGMLFQDPDDQILGLTVEEDVGYGPEQLGMERGEAARVVEESLKAVGMWGKRERPPFELSRGERKRAAIAGVLAGGAEVLLLDEPMASLDPVGRDELVVLLGDFGERGMTVVAATHDVDFAAGWADEVVLMEGGRVLAHGPVSLLVDERVMREAGLALPLVARPFGVIRGEEVIRKHGLPGSVEAAEELLLLLTEEERKSAAGWMGREGMTVG
ncbi:MAG: energy-coupling factor ABC transporter permease [Verrucomicrobiales bacterium]|nr:energy-coupling factor ABC transporter permease [Verrucomicrobiales bacterium]